MGNHKRCEEFAVKNVLVIDSPHCSIWGDEENGVSVSPKSGKFPMKLDHLLDALLEYSYHLNYPVYPKQLDMFVPVGVEGLKT